MKLYYCNKINNFGDLLNECIFEKCFNIKIDYAELYCADAIGIGSVLENTFWTLKDYKNILKYLSNKSPLFVLSSGFGWDLNHYKSKFRYLYNTLLKRNLSIVGLRGKYTENICKMDLGLDTSKIVLGDFGLLSSYLISNTKEEKIYDIGICPHYADKSNPIFHNITSKYPNSLVLDTLQPPLDFLKNLNMCKTILSTGLHPLIAADSLGIPNIWARISEKTTSKFKFKDYYSVFDEDIEPYYVINNNISPEFIIKNYKIKQKRVESVKQKLLDRMEQFRAILC